MLVADQFGAARHFSVDQQVGNFLEFALIGNINYVIAAIMQVVSRTTDGA